MHNRQMRVVATALVLVVLAVAAGCSGGESDDEGASTTARTNVYLLRDDAIAAASREIPEGDAGAEAALLALLRDQTDDESAEGLTSAIPTGTELNGLEISDGVATVDLSAPFSEGASGDEMDQRLAQVVYTLTRDPAVDSVRFEVDGESLIRGQALTRDNFEALTPPILVESPAFGEAVSSPLTLSGTANTFEANFEYEVLSPEGDKLAGTFVTATCGTGCRGTFDEQVAFDAADLDEVRLIVFERSAEDGSRTKEVEIPLAIG